MMSKGGEEKHAGRGHPRPNALTQPRAVQHMKTLLRHIGYRFFSRPSGQNLGIRSLT